MKFSSLPIAIIFIASCALSAGASTQKHPKSHAKKVSYTKVRKEPARTGPLYATRPDAMQLADDIAQKRNLDRAWVREAVGQSRYLAGIAKAVTPPPVGVPKNWALYRSRFIEPVRVRAGVKFWQANAEVLQRAQDETGVPAEIIVGIVGVESIYGQQTGTYRVMDALTTLALDFPQTHPRASARSAFFRAELEEFLALTARTRTNPLALLGSYAGAMGMPQFMPSSWVKYAIDFDSDGRVDLFNSSADVIGSVANYFKSFGWKSGMPTHYAVQFDPQTLDMAALMTPDILPTFVAEAFSAKGALLDAQAQQHAGPLALVELQNGDAPPQYVAGTENFYVITRYNWSSYYAMAVIELGREVAAARNSVVDVQK